MCQSLQFVYKFCSCQGEFYQETCSKPTATCKHLLENPIELKLSCYCEWHSSQTFKTVRQDIRDTSRITKEYNKILAKEEKRKQSPKPSITRIKITNSPIPDASAAQQPSQPTHTANLRNSNKLQLKPLPSHTKPEPPPATRPLKTKAKRYYGMSWTDRLLKRKDPIAQARARAEDAARREAQESAIANEGAKPPPKNSILRSCLVM
jgi:hypothetical protein